MTISTRNATFAMALIVGLMGAGLVCPAAHADTPVTTFTVVSSTDTGVELTNYTGAHAAASTSFEGQLVGATPGFGTAVWAVSPAKGIDFKAVDINGTVQLFPGDQKELTDRRQFENDGVVSFHETSIEYRQFTSLSNDAAAVSLSIPNAPVATIRDRKAAAAAAGVLCASSVDYSTTTTEPTFGEGAVWCTSVGKTVTKAWSSESAYVVDFAFAPGSTTHGAAVVVELDRNNLAAVPVASTREFDIGKNLAFQFSSASSGSIEIPSDATGVELQWALRNNLQVPLAAISTADAVSFYDNGALLATAPAATFIAVSSRGSSILPSPATNRPTPLLTISGLPKTSVVSYKSKMTAKASAVASLFDSQWSVPASGSFPKTIAKNTCVTFAAAATVFSQAASIKKCVKVSHKLLGSVSKKGRILSVQSSATTVKVELLPAKKGRKVTVINKALKVKSGKATLTLKKPGKYKISAAATKSNEPIVLTITVK